MYLHLHEIRSGGADEPEQKKKKCSNEKRNVSEIDKYDIDLVLKIRV